jgi:acylphosphatase
LRSRFVQNDVEAILGRTKENPAFPLLVLATSGVTPRDLAGGPLERLLDFQLISVDGPERLQADRLVETLTEALAGKSPRRPDVVRRRVVIHGRVQGVAFRDAMRRLAQEHGVTGWVQNNADGTVEAVFEGEPEAVERLVAFAHEGPPGARVDDVEVSEQDPEGLGGFDLTSERPREPEHATPVPGDRVEWIPDSADSISRQDLLKRRPLARALAVRLQRIRIDEPDASFLIHVDGPWGSGKSTLLDFLAGELEQPGDDRWLVIRYDAWRQTRVGPPWWTLLVHLRQALASELPLRQRLSLRFAEMRFRIRTAGLLYLLVLAVAAALFVLIGPDQIAAYITAISALVGGALAIGKFFLWDSAHGARTYEQVQKNPMESLASHFGWLVGRSQLPVVFLIDEVDRCADAQVVDLLDSIQTLIRDAPHRQHLRQSAAPYFVIAADGAWIRRSYELAHERMVQAVAEPGRPLGYLFLDKIFQLTVPMPSLSSQHQAVYFRALLTGRGIGDESPQLEAVKRIAEQLRTSAKETDTLDALGAAPPEVRQILAPLAVERLNAAEIERETKEHVLEKFAPLLEPNPRAIKRLIVAYGIERSVRTLEDNLVPRDTLVLWTILRTRWPGLGEYLTEQPEAIKLIGTRRRLPPGTPPELEALFHSPAVDYVASFPEGGPLTPELVADCVGLKLDQPRRSHSTVALLAKIDPSSSTE